MRGDIDGDEVGRDNCGGNKGVGSGCGYDDMRRRRRRLARWRHDLWCLVLSCLHDQEWPVKKKKDLELVKAYVRLFWDSY